MTEQTVLYAEDDANDALFMQMAFQKACLPPKLTLVEDGSQAIDYLAGKGKYTDRQQHPLPSLLLLDLNLPIKSGLQVLEWIRERPAFNHLKVVVVTSSGQESDKAQARQLGATDYLLKPSEPSRLADIVRNGWERWLVTSLPT